MKTSELQKPEMTLFNKVIDVISGIFVPIINVLMAAALLKGVLMLLVNLGVLAETDGAYQIFYAISDGFFYFLPVFLAYTASKKLKADSFTSVLIAAALVYPKITAVFENGAGIDFFGIPITRVTYPSGVIPIILAVGLLHYIELPLEKYLPKTIKGFMKPMIALIIVVPITFILFGPIGALFGNLLAGAYSLLHGFSPVVSGAIFGLIWQPMVVFGLQWGLVPVIIENIRTLGADTILPTLGAAVMGQAGAAMAVSLITKNKKLKILAMSCSITAILGVTEPVLYGITVPLKRPMLAACIAGAVGGAFVGTSHATALAFAFPSFISLVVYLGEGFWTFLLSLFVGFIIGFILTFLFKFKDPENELELEELEEMEK